MSRLSRLLIRVRESLLVRSLVHGPLIFTLPSWWRFLRVEKLGPRRSGPGGVLALNVRRFGDQPLYVRSGATDWETVHASLIGRYHRPPDELKDVKTILDLGTNIGVTVADLAVRHPDARIVGVELDADNVALARRNTQRWADRAEIVHGAVWTDDGTIAYGGARGEWAYQVVPAMRTETASAPIDEVTAFSMVTLIDRLVPGGGPVDYVKMDVEGAEAFLLERGGEWAERVRCIKVEVHQPLDIPTARRQLERLGFTSTSAAGGILVVTGHHR